MVRISISPYNPLWPAQFASIAADLHADLQSFSAPFHSIEHIGSTSVPSLLAKPIIDIMIVIRTPTPYFDAETAITYPDKTHFALVFGSRPGGYRCIGTGGVPGRWSFKLYRADLVARNVYVVVKDTVVYRSYLTLRETLRKPWNADLRGEYAAVKTALAEREWGDVMEYAGAKDDVVRKILRRGGWTEEQVDEKERGVVRGWGGAGFY